MNGGRFRASTWQGGRDPHYIGNVLVLELDEWQPPAPWSGPTIPVGVIDTGILLDASGAPPAWAAGRMVYDKANDADTVPPDDPVAGHGTFVSALLLGEAPNAVVHMKGVIDHVANGDREDQQVATAITELAADVKLINMSFSGTTNEPGPPVEIMNALNQLDDDVVVVAAAGNDASGQHVFPACLTPKNALMVAVGAVDESVRPTDGTGLPPLADFSNNGPWLRAVASGVYVIGPGHLDARSVARSGTSLSAALVTGRIAATANERGISVRAAAEALLADGVPHVTAYSVNGPYRTPYVHANAVSRPRDW